MVKVEVSTTVVTNNRILERGITSSRTLAAVLRAKVDFRDTNATTNKGKEKWERKKKSTYVPLFIR